MSDSLHVCTKMILFSNFFVFEIFFEKKVCAFFLSHVQSVALWGLKRTTVSVLAISTCVSLRLSSYLCCLSLSLSLSFSLYFPLLTVSPPLSLFPLLLSLHLSSFLSRFLPCASLFSLPSFSKRFMYLSLHLSFYFSVNLLTSFMHLS